MPQYFRELSEKALIGKKKTIQSHKACVDTVFEILNSSCSILDGLFKLLMFIPKNETSIKHKIWLPVKFSTEIRRFKNPVKVWPGSAAEFMIGGSTEQKWQMWAVI